MYLSIKTKATKNFYPGLNILLKPNNSSLPLKCVFLFINVIKLLYHSSADYQLHDFI